MSAILLFEGHIGKNKSMCPVDVEIVVDEDDDREENGKENTTNTIEDADRVLGQIERVALRVLKDYLQIEIAKLGARGDPHRRSSNSRAASQDCLSGRH